MKRLKISIALGLFVIGSLMAIRAWAETPCSEQCKRFKECMKAAYKASFSGYSIDETKKRILEDRCSEQYRDCLSSCGPI